MCLNVVKCINLLQATTEVKVFIVALYVPKNGRIWWICLEERLISQGLQASL